MKIFKKKEVKKGYYEVVLKNSNISNEFDDVHYRTLSNSDNDYIAVFENNGVKVFAVEKSAIKKLNYVTPHTCDCEACRKQGDRVLVLI